MRQIKFRAWDKTCKSMLDSGGNNISIHLNGAVSIDSVWATDDVELMQFTGMLDKNGVEIYEGDIVSSDYYLPEIKSVAVVTFEQMDNWCRFGFDSAEQDSFIYGNLTVIGNIHENPELIKN